MLKNKEIEEVREMDEILRSVANIPVSTGWISTIRRLLNMSLEQLGKRLNTTAQAIKGMEIREEKGSITLNTLKKAANGLDMDVVYAFVPRQSLEAMIAQNALNRATWIATQERLQQPLGLFANDDEELFYEKVKQLQTNLIKKLHKSIWDE